MGFTVIFRLLVSLMATAITGLVVYTVQIQLTKPSLWVGTSPQGLELVTMYATLLWVLVPTAMIMGIIFSFRQVNRREQREEEF